MISPERQAQVLRLYHAERWRVGTIATQLKLHRDTVARVLALAGLPPIAPAQRASMIDPYMPFIRQTLETFPKLTATRLYEMVRQRGYRGSASRFRQQIALCRPRPVAQAYLRLRTLPGEQAQSDWGHFGHIQIGQARRPLMAFVMVLSWSRKVFLQFFVNATTASFVRGHVAAFQAWQGVPRVVLYDNLKSAVLERQGELIRFNPELLSLSAYYRFEPRPVAPARGNEKGVSSGPSATSGRPFCRASVRQPGGSEHPGPSVVRTGGRPEALSRGHDINRHPGLDAGTLASADVAREPVQHRGGAGRSCGQDPVCAI
ncbi:IS21 family transposase [Neopusillimonas aromaticivorans]|uniref:IS21 family transposase n=1 Tax=Neopusillimonas aromaticivorans TaxID=2979868 RepID=UPI002599FAAD|nr:IS21 family transposase [Neopusillimonas aromaticivorans]WJJ94232.1 IS21 family transposase [Neopusillimonas aromaticivorans]